MLLLIKDIESYFINHDEFCVREDFIFMGVSVGFKMLFNEMSGEPEKRRKQQLYSWSCAGVIPVAMSEWIC